MAEDFDYAPSCRPVNRKRRLRILRIGFSPRLALYCRRFGMSIPIGREPEAPGGAEKGGRACVIVILGCGHD
ncbi:protein of unknown function [Magnetospirillum sp. XM-1]|nr:protein of unknown function [Magnetospirillum sp. XM-1]